MSPNFAEKNLKINGAEQQEVLQAPGVLPVNGIALFKCRSEIPCVVTLLSDVEPRAFIN
jgi:hypothetical protein